jgi:hypothetical protein
VVGSDSGGGSHVIGKQHKRAEHHVVSIQWIRRVSPFSDGDYVQPDHGFIAQRKQGVWAFGPKSSVYGTDDDVRRWIEDGARLVTVTPR